MNNQNITTYPGSLHNHTQYSNIRLRDCIIKENKLIDYAIQLGHRAVAITDHECISSWIKVEEYADKIHKTYPDFKVIRGNEIYLCRNGLNAENFNKDFDSYYHFILLARDREGAKQLMEISTRAWKRSYMGRGMRRVPTYYQDLIDIIGVNPGHVIASSACFVKDTQVLTSNGYKNIQDISSEDYIYNRYGIWEKVNYPTSRFYDGEGYEISFLEGIEPIKCTENHKFLVTTNNWGKTSNPIRWVEANSLEGTCRGNKATCLFPISPNYNNKNIIYRNEWEKTLRKISYSPKYLLPNEIKITPEVIRLFGLWLGDGSISIKDNVKRVTLTFSDEEFLFYWNNFVKKASEELCVNWHKKDDLSHHKIELSSDSIELVELFYYLFGLSHAKDKYIPNRLLHISEELDWNLFFGYALADGYFRTREKDGYTYGEFTAASISKKLILNMQELLKSLGIRSSISITAERTDKLGVHHNESYYLTSSNNAWIRFQKKSFCDNDSIKGILISAQIHDNKKHIVYNGIRYKKVYIKKIKKVDLHEQVYCLNVNSHSFCCEGVIVHNCLGGCLPKQLLKYEQTKSVELYNKIVNWAVQIGNIFGKENFYIELQPSATKEQTLANRLLVNFAKEQGFKYIITTDSHYLKKEDRLIHKAYLNAQDGDREVDAFYMTTYMMGTEELESHLDLTREELNKAYSSINEIIDKCEEFSLRRSLRIPELLWRPLLGEKYDYQEAFKLMPTLEKFYNSEYKSDHYLVDAILDGIKLHPDLQNEEAYANLEDNLQRTWESSEVNKARWSAYYLNLQRNIDEFWNAGTIVGPARGSGGGFLLLYCLDVIQMDTLRETTKTYPWRFLNPKRESVLDIDTDIEGGRRAQVLQHLRKVYGEDYVANVATFRTEKSKSAILTAARGLGIDVDIAQYIASLIPADRGQLRSLSQCFYGDEENGWPPIKQFVNEMTNNYPELWQVAQSIEGLICGSGLHAGGVIFVDEPFTNSTALMRAPDGTICTQFELHDAEKASLIKIDALSVEAMDKIHNCLDLLCDAGLVERKATLRETYENAIGLYKLDRTNPEMWEMVLKHKILSLFQMEKQSGISGIALAKPHSVDELATLNSVIRLMAPEKGAEQPLDMWARYRNNINEWYNEMRDYGLTEEQIEWLSKSPAISSGICESQEGLMQLLQEPRLGSNDLSFADKCRKAIAKKQGKLFEECEQQYFKNAEEKNCEMKLVHYVWDVLLRVQRGYSFCKAHTLAYSLVALQEMNLAHNYPIIFWNCACLINDAGGNEVEDIEEDDNVYNCVDEEYYNEMEDFTEDDEPDVEDSYDEDEDCDGYPVEVKVLKNGKKKKKTKTTNYGKIATAIGKIRQEGVDIAPPDINRSTYTFSPDVETNTIRYGLSGITRIGEDLVKQIIANRPYSDLPDFLSKNKLTKPQVVNLIKSGAFDSICEDRVTVMSEYIDSIADKKKRLTLQNMQMLIDHNLIPHEFEFEIKVYNFNKYLKKYCKDGTNFKLVDYPLEFYQSHFDTDLLNYSSDGAAAIIGQKTWDNIYQKYMDNIRPFIKKNNETLLDTLNEQLVQEVWDKYCKGSISKWEMDSVSFYSHEHELAKLKDRYYGIVDFQSLGSEPEIERVFTTREGKTIPMFKLVKIAGTVLDKNKQKKTVELLTKSGVVTVKVYGVFSEYDRQISVKDPTTGKKKVIEKSMFSRGNKLIITGIRQEDSFIAKMYKNTPGHRIVQILDVNDDGTAVIKEERAEVPT